MDIILRSPSEPREVSEELAREELTGLAYVFWCRFLVLSLLATWIATTLPIERSSLYVAAIIVFAALGAAPYLLTRSCLPLLERSVPASVVFMCDDKAGAYWDAYQVSKRGLAAMAELLAAEYAGSGLRINGYNPGPTRTGLQLRAFPAADENANLPKADTRLEPMLYLLSDRASENGQILGST